MHGNIVEAFGGHANKPWPVVNLWFTSYVKDIKVTHVHRVQVGEWEEKKKKNGAMSRFGDQVNTLSSTTQNPMKIKTFIRATSVAVLATCHCQ